MKFLDADMKLVRSPSVHTLFYFKNMVTTCFDCQRHLSSGNRKNLLKVSLHLILFQEHGYYMFRLSKTAVIRQQENLMKVSLHLILFQEHGYYMFRLSKTAVIRQQENLMKVSLHLILFQEHSYYMFRLSKTSIIR